MSANCQCVWTNAHGEVSAQTTNPGEPVVVPPGAQGVSPEIYSLQQTQIPNPPQLPALQEDIQAPAKYDIKFSAREDDHNGWYLMDGRAYADTGAPNPDPDLYMPDTRQAFMAGGDGTPSQLTIPEASNKRAMVKEEFPDFVLPPVTIHRADILQAESDYDHVTDESGTHVHTLQVEEAGAHTHTYTGFPPVDEVRIGDEQVNGLAVGPSQLVDGTTFLGGAHEHGFSTNLVDEQNGAHTHTYNRPPIPHTDIQETFSFGEYLPDPVDLTPPAFVVNAFIYLGEAPAP